MKYLQCELSISTSDNREFGYKIAWLPEQFAKKGLIVDTWDAGEWSTGWKVKKVYSGVVLEADYLVKRSQDYKNQRKASDI